MFRGVNPLNLDAKGRLAMPVRHRDRLQESCRGQLVLTIDRDRCLLVYPFPEWEEFERKLNELPSFNEIARRMQRLYIGHATDVNLDGAGRILLPPPLREFAELDKRVVLIGQGNRFELWNEGIWEERREQWLTEDNGDQPLPQQLETLSF